MIIFQRKHPGKEKQRGAAMIEMALTMPLLLLLLFGIVNFGIALYNKAVITNASREAARAGIVFDSDPVNHDEIENIAISYCTNRLVTFGASSPVTAIASDVGGDTLRVRVEYDFKSVAGKLMPGMGAGLKLTAETRMKYEV